MFLSKLGYSELIQRLFEKMAFFYVDPLLSSFIIIIVVIITVRDKALRSVPSLMRIVTRSYMH